MSEAQEDQTKKVSGQLKEHLSVDLPADAGIIEWLDVKKYPVNFGLKYEEWSTDVATAYDVNDDQYALVFSKSFAPRLDVISSLQVIENYAIQKVFDYGKIKHPSKQDEYLVVILEKIKGIKLSEMIEKEGRFSEKRIADLNILTQLLGALKELHEEEIVYGILCTNNVYWDESFNRIVLRECISHYPGFLQEPAYESLDALLADKMGKSHMRCEDDLFALGVVLFSLLVGGVPIRGGIDRRLLTVIRLENGSLETMISFARSHQKLFLSTHLEDILRGLLVDSMNERWGIHQVERWRLRKDNVVPVLNHHKESIVPFVFDETDCFSLRMIAHALFLNWDIARKSLKLVDLSRWLSVNLKRTDLAEKIDMLAARGDNNVIYTDERITKVISILDPEGPIRYKDISIELEGIGTYFTQLYYDQDENKLKQFMRLFSEGLLLFSMKHRTHGHRHYSQHLKWDALDIKQYIKKKTLGFGLERCLYDFCPFLPCQSPVLQGRYVLTVGDLLEALDSIFEENSDSHDFLDSQIAAFIASKLNLEEDIRLRTIQNFPKIAKDPHLLMTGLLTVAQSQSHVGALKSLSKVVSARLQRLIDTLHSKTIRESMNSELEQVTEFGDIKAIFKTMSADTYIRKDFYGIRDARHQYRILSYQIDVLKRKENIERLAYHFGLRISVSVSYILCAITVVYIINQSL